MFACIYNSSFRPVFTKQRGKIYKLSSKSPQIFSIQRKSITRIFFYSSSVFKNRHTVLNLENSLYLKNKYVCRSRTIGADILFHETALHYEMNRKQIECIIM